MMWLFEKSVIPKAPSWFTVFFLAMLYHIFLGFLVQA